MGTDRVLRARDARAGAADAAARRRRWRSSPRRGRYALWSLLSVTWAEAPGRAVEGAGRNLLYAALVSLPLVTLPDRRSGVRMAWTVTAGLAAVVILTFGSALIDGAAQFLAGRLNDPVGYRNATAALMAMAFWPLVCLAAQRAPNPLLRAAAFSAATTALGLAYLTQSRGVLIGFGCGAVVALALGPDRLRRAWLTIMAVAGVAIVSGRLLNPYDAFLATAKDSASAIDSAMHALAVVTVASFAVALVLALFDGGARLSESAQRAVGRVAGALLVLLTVGAIVGGLVVVGDPVQLVKDKASEFKQLETLAPGETRLGSTSRPALRPLARRAQRVQGQAADRRRRGQLPAALLRPAQDRPQPLDAAQPADARCWPRPAWWACCCCWRCPSPQSWRSRAAGARYRTPRAAPPPRCWRPRR